VVDHDHFPPQQHVQAAVAEARTLRGQLAQPAPKFAVVIVARRR
jgi:hypothetical protein